MERERLSLKAKSINGDRYEYYMNRLKREYITEARNNG